jgi:hypothetical protein
MSETSAREWFARWFGSRTKRLTGRRCAIARDGGQQEVSRADAAHRANSLARRERTAMEPRRMYRGVKGETGRIPPGVDGSLAATRISGRPVAGDGGVTVTVTAPRSSGSSNHVSPGVGVWPSAGRKGGAAVLREWTL